MSTQIDFHTSEKEWKKDMQKNGLTQHNLRSVTGFYEEEDLVYYFPTDMLIKLQSQLTHLELISGFYNIEHAFRENFREESLMITLEKGKRTFQLDMPLYYSQGDYELSLNFTVFEDTEEGTIFSDELSTEERKDVEISIYHARSFLEEQGYSRLELAVNNCIYSFSNFGYLLEEGEHHEEKN